MKIRVGKFRIAYMLLDLARTGGGAFEHLRALLAGFVVVNVERCYNSDSVVYTAIGEVFDEISEGEMVPDYEIEMIQTPGEETRVKAFRRLGRCRNCGAPTGKEKKDG